MSKIFKFLSNIYYTYHIFYGIVYTDVHVNETTKSNGSEFYTKFTNGLKMKLKKALLSFGGITFT